MSRQTIREAFKTAIQKVYSGPIYQTRLTDNRNDPESVQIYLTSGDVETYTTFTETTADIVIEYAKQGATDTQLDAIADQIISTLLNDSDLKLEIKHCRFQGFTYEPQESGYQTISLTFRILY